MYKWAYYFSSTSDFHDLENFISSHLPEKSSFSEYYYAYKKYSKMYDELLSKPTGDNNPEESTQTE